MRTLNLNKITSNFMPNKLTFRELRTNLSKYLDRMEQGEVFEVRGRVLGFCLDARTRPMLVVHPSVDDEFKPEMIEPGEVVPCAMESIKVFTDLCSFCNKTVQLYYGPFENGENPEVCENCLLRLLGEQARKFINEANKVPQRERIVTKPDGTFRMRKQAVLNDNQRNVKYCTKCKCQAVSGNSSLCVKCGKKKKK